MARVIQDSDDEEEVLIEPGILNPDVAPKAYEAVVTRVDVEVHALVVDQQPQQTPLVRGTSSSEKLRREIEVAHTALWQPTPSVATTDGRRQRAADDSEIIPPTAASNTLDHDRKNLKRTRTTGGILKTYSGKEDRQRTREKPDLFHDNTKSDDIFDIPSSARSTHLPHGSVASVQAQDHGSPPAPTSVEGPKPKRRKTTRRSSQQPAMDPPSQPFQVEPPDTERSLEQPVASIKLFRDFETPSNLNSSLEGAFANHNPNVLFPESSSVLTSGATATQCTTRTFVTDAPHQNDSADGLNPNPTPALGEMATKGVDVQADLPIRTAAPLSQTEAILQSKAIIAPLQEQDVVVSIVPVDFSMKHAEQFEEPNNKRKRIVSRIMTVDEPELAHDDGINTANKHVGAEEEEPVHRSTRNKRQKLEPELTTQAHSDELTVGLPQEMYKPRPSRSRGVPLPEEKIPDQNLTVSPTKAAKSKIKRRKTTGAISAYSSSLREMGFRSSQVQTALANAEGNFDDALEWLTARNDAEFGSQRGSVEPELKVEKKATIKLKLKPVTEEEEDDENGTAMDLPTRAKELLVMKTKRGRPKKQQQASTLEETPFDHEADDGELAKDTAEEEFVRLPPTVTQKKGKEQQQVLIMEEEPADIIVIDIEPAKDIVVEEVMEQPPPPPATEKKGRGRPSRKSSKRVMGEVDKPIATGTEKDAATKTSEPLVHDIQDDVLTETDRNVSKATTKTNKPARNAVEKETTPASTLTTARIEPDVTPAKITPEKPSPSTTKSAKPHSPIKKDKIAFRVGLNRRMRIEPLLKIIRK